MTDFVYIHTHKILTKMALLIWKQHINWSQIYIRGQPIVNWKKTTGDL